jgi:streptogramin lyase
MWDLSTGERRRFGKPGATVREVNARFVCTEIDGALDFYDAHTLDPVADDLTGALTPRRRSILPAANWSIPLRDGRLFVVRGQEYALEAAPGRPHPQPALTPVPAERPATRIHTLISDAQSRLWGSSAFGQTIFRFDPASGEVWNSQTVCDAGGEVYGMAFVRGRLFMAAYAGGDHIVYDPAQPWNQIDNINPRALEPARPALIRPSGRSVIGPDGAFWTGWMAAYGVYGGGLSRVDPITGAVQCWRDPIPGQSITGLTADECCLYFITSGQANGLPEKIEPLHCVAWSAEGRILRERVYEAGARLRAICATRAGVALAVDQRLEWLDPETLEVLNAVALPSACQTLLAWGSDGVAAFCGAQLLRVRPATGEVTPVCDLPGEVYAATVTPAGDLCFAHERDLYRLPAGAS